MENITYEAAIQAIIQKNQGRLPILSDALNIDLSHEASQPAPSSVAELLALALAEIAATATPAPVAIGVRVAVPTESAHSGKPVRLAKLLKQAVESVN